MATGFANISIERRSSAEQVAQTIKEMLLRGEAAPGTKLFEIPIAAQLQVSRHTVREAMRLLAAEGLVKHNFQRGVIVTELDEDDVRDLFRARRALELAGIAASRDAAKSDLDALRDATRAIRTAAERNDWSASVAADLTFHRAVVALIGSELVNQFYLNLQTKLRLTRAWAEREHASSRELWVIHNPVLVAIEDHHYAQAAEILGSIVDQAEDRLVSAIRARKEVVTGNGGLSTGPPARSPKIRRKRLSHRKPPKPVRRRVKN